MYERLLVAVDHSPGTGRVLTAARQLARLSGGEIWVLHVRERPVSKFAAPETETAADTRHEVDAVAAELSSEGIKAHGEARHAVFGYAAREILASAAEHEADVIVIGSKGHGDLAGLLLGSTAHKVIQLADRPVMVVP